MGKAGRFACILTPMLLTLASLITIVLVMIGQMSSSGNKAPSTSLGRTLWFFKADTSGFRDDPNLIDSISSQLDDHNVEIDNKLINSLQGQATTSRPLEDFYQVGLFAYCSGTKDESGKETITFCSSSKRDFWFDPISVWGLKNTTAQNVIGDEKLQNGLDTYKKVAGWMVWSYIIALILTVAEFILGFFAIFSRWGSLVTTIVSTTQTVFIFAAAITSTAVYSILAGVFETALKEIHVEASIGKQMLSVVWLAVAFSLASGLFWLFSVCCCSGKSAHKKVSAEKTPYTYERVASPAFPAQQQTSYAGGASGPQQTGTAYEPFRQSHA